MYKHIFTIAPDKTLFSIKKVYFSYFCMKTRMLWVLIRSTLTTYVTIEKEKKFNWMLLGPVVQS